MKGVPVLALTLLVAAGCGGPDASFPEKIGTAWIYSVRTGFGAEHVEEVRIARRVTVAGASGVEMSGPLGASRWAWRNGILWIEGLSNAGFVPPAPLLARDRQARIWRGELRTVYGRERASGRLRHRNEKLEIGGRTFETVRTELELERPSGVTLLVTWFAPEVGVVRQEQRTRGALDLRLEWVAGPRRS